MDDFIGVKIALINNNELLMIQRDNKPGLRFAGLWDFPGGGRENNETPFECAAREVKEELGLTINESSVMWQKMHPAMHDPEISAYFLVASITDDDVVNVNLGDEGQGWKMISISEFMDSSEVVEPLKGRLTDFLDSIH